MRKDNKSGCSGVYFLTERGRWQARPWDPIRKRKVWIGLFKDKSDAVKAVEDFNRKLKRRKPKTLIEEFLKSLN